MQCTRQPTMSEAGPSSTDGWDAEDASLELARRLQEEEDAACSAAEMAPVGVSAPSEAHESVSLWRRASSAARARSSSPAPLARLNLCRS